MLLEQLTSAQVTEWLAFLAVEDEDRLKEEKAKMELANLRAGMIAATVINMAGKVSTKYVTARDLIGGGQALSVTDRIKAFFGVRGGVR